MIIHLRSALLLAFLPFFCLALPGSARADAPPAVSASQSAAPAPAPQATTAPAPQQHVRQKQAVYFEPTYLNLLRAMIRVKGFDIDNDDMLDAYTVIEGCDLYTKFYKDDFAWRQVRTMYRKSLAQKINVLPEYFSFVVPLLLDRYDFQSGIFRFSQNSGMRNVHRMVLSEHPVSTCAGKLDFLNRLPTQIGVFLTPFTIEGLKISPDQAETLIGNMDNKKDADRIVYARFHIHIISGPLLPVSVTNKNSHYDFQGNLETISFFQDRDLQRPLWVYRQVYESEEQKAQELEDILNLKPSQVEDSIERAPVVVPPTASPPNE